MSIRRFPIRIVFNLPSLYKSVEGRLSQAGHVAGFVDSEGQLLSSQVRDVFQRETPSLGEHLRYLLCKIKKGTPIEALEGDLLRACENTSLPLRQP